MADLLVSLLRLWSCASRLGFGMIKRIALVLCLGCVVGVPAYAFEIIGASGAGKTAETGVVPLGLSENKTVSEKSTGGGLVFPGLGSLGVLPKLDFGLELLYGDNQPQVVVPEENNADAEGLRIQGTLKHRF